MSPTNITTRLGIIFLDFKTSTFLESSFSSICSAVSLPLIIFAVIFFSYKLFLSLSTNKLTTLYNSS